jgi:hypothetical protein
LLSEIQAEILTVLPKMPRVEEPGPYLLGVAKNVLREEANRCTRGGYTSSLDAPRTGQNQEEYTLLDMLAAQPATTTTTSAELSPWLAEALSSLRPSAQLIIQRVYQFDNWTPKASRQKARPPKPNRTRKQAMGSYYFALSTLRRQLGQQRPLATANQE